MSASFYGLKGMAMPKTAADRWRSAAQRFWEAAIFPLLALILVGLCVVVTTLLGTVVDPKSTWSAWQAQLFLWVVSPSLALAAGLLVGRMMRNSEWSNGLWKLGLIWIPAFVLATVALSSLVFFLPVNPLGPTDQASARAMLSAFLYLSAWGVGVPLGLVAGLWLVARGSEDVSRTAASNVHRRG
jgi:hypothetical protein